MTAKLYGFDRSFLHDTTERDPFVIDMVRADDYLKLEAKIAALQEQLSSYSMRAGQADQRKSESDAVRVALGFNVDADDVAPCDLVDAIAALQEQVRELAAENSVLKNAIEQCKEFFKAWVLNRISPYNGAYLNALCAHAIEETPATDAALREIHAQGVEALRDSISDIDNGIENTIDLHHYCTDFAFRIRAGQQP